MTTGTPIHPDILAAAIAAHEVNRAYCASIGDMSQPSWEDAPRWQKESAIKGVEFVLNNPTSSPEDSHKSWLAEKEKDGWKYGPTKNPETKEHPCFVPYEDLPALQRKKDYLFQTVVRAMLGIANAESWIVGEAPISRDHQVKAVKQLRKNLDVVLGDIAVIPPSREMSLVRTKLEEAVMWLGKQLGAYGNPNPYPESRNPGNAQVEPTADGLKHV